MERRDRKKECRNRQKIKEILGGKQMTWWNVIKVAGQEMAGDMETVDDGGIKPAETMEEAREHPIDPALAEKALTGGQKKLDKDKDGDIDAKDFKQLREEKK